MAEDIVRFELKGYDQYVETLKKLGIKVKRREILKILRRQAKPTLEAVKNNAPREQFGRTMTRRTRDGGFADEYKPGNLKESIKIITGSKGKSKVNPTVYVGPNVKKRGKFDGYYGFFVETGTSVSGHPRQKGPGQIARPFIGPAAKAVEQQVGNAISIELVKYLDKKERELGLK